LGRQFGIEDPEQWLEQCPQRVFDNWAAAHAVEPFGGEQQLLARVVSLLYVIAMQQSDFESVKKLADAIMPAIMPSDWVERPEVKPEDVDGGVSAFEKHVAQRYG
jgi:hypothetical protein